MKTLRDNALRPDNASTLEDLFELTDEMLESTVGGATAAATASGPRGGIARPGPIAVHDWDGNPLHI